MAKKGESISEETRLKMRNAKLGKKRKPFTEEHIANMRKDRALRKQKKLDELQANNKQDR